MIKRLLITTIFCTLSTNLFATQIERDITGKIVRSKEVLYQFQKQNPCPITHKNRGACAGFVKDHIIPLCAGGEDSVQNLKWSEHTYSIFRDAQEKHLCSELRHLGEVQMFTPKQVLCEVIKRDNLVLLKNDICK